MTYEGYGKHEGAAMSRVRIDGVQARGSGTSKERQFLNFVEAVRELGCDQSGQEFKQMLAQLLPAKRSRGEKNVGNGDLPSRSANAASG
jgi:hypothetical protein